jgi:uncharacterized membrane protein YcaP (DUF421 family)
MTLDDVFGVTNHVTVAQECARAALIFVYGLALVRSAGRRVFGKWSALDIIVSIMIGSNLSRSITGSAPLWGTLTATTLLMLLHWILSHAAAWSPRMSQLVEGRSVRLGEQGRTEQRLLARHAVSEADLDEALRTAGLDGLSRAQLIMLEPSGRISVLKER